LPDSPESVRFNSRILLGRFPFWRGESPLVEALEPVYRDASRGAMQLFADEQVQRQQVQRPLSTSASGE
jgi:hypothetical protein